MDLLLFFSRLPHSYEDRFSTMSRQIFLTQQEKSHDMMMLGLAEPKDILFPKSVINGSSPEPPPSSALTSILPNLFTSTLPSIVIQIL